MFNYTEHILNHYANFDITNYYHYLQRRSLSVKKVTSVNYIARSIKTKVLKKQIYFAPALLSRSGFVWVARVLLLHSDGIGRCVQNHDIPEKVFLAPEMKHSLVVEIKSIYFRVITGKQSHKLAFCVF